GIDLSIRTNTNPPVIGSVRMVLSGPVSRTQLEGRAPYSLFGDLPGIDYSGVPFPQGTYTLTATAYDGEYGAGNIIGATSIQFSITPGGISAAREMPAFNSDSKPATTLNLSPNPAVSSTQVSVSDQEVEIADIFIHDISGKLVKRLKGQSTRSTSGRYEIDVSTYVRGVYLIRIVTQDGEIISKKLIVGQ
ncbi:T9SS type A sorting domain-containing protein, partial [Robiginitalea aurantiaca]